jgi:peptide deformylase
VKIKAWGLLARVFQHETDHLNGKIFLDHVKRR